MPLAVSLRLPLPTKHLDRQADQRFCYDRPTDLKVQGDLLRKRKSADSILFLDFALPSRSHAAGRLLGQETNPIIHRCLPVRSLFAHHFVQQSHLSARHPGRSCSHCGFYVSQEQRAYEIFLFMTRGIAPDGIEFLAVCRAFLGHQTRVIFNRYIITN